MVTFPSGIVAENHQAEWRILLQKLVRCDCPRESGDLAGAVRDLSALLCRDETACERSARSVPMLANSPTMHNTGQMLAPCAVGGQ